MNGNGFQLPVYLVKKVATSGHVADLLPLELGIYDRKTFNVATGSGNGKEFFLAGGSPHTKDALSKFYKGMQTRKESEPFFGRDIESFQKIFPSRAKNEQWVIGFDGSSTSTSLKFVAGETYKLKLRLFGEPVYSLFNKSVEKIIPLFTGCVNDDDCSTGCVADPIGVKTQVIAWAKAINDNVELQEFKVKAVPIFSDYAATAASTYDYTLTVSDDGSAEALQDVQRAYPGITITRKSFVRGVSIYEMKAQNSPANFTSKSYSVAVSDCLSCTSGTFTPAKDVYIVSRPLAGTEDLDNSGARQTYADVVGTDYETQTKQVIPTTGVNTTTEVITKSAHGFVTGEAVVYNDGSFAVLGGLTNGVTYYVNVLTSSTFKLYTTQANAIAGGATGLMNLTSTGNNAQSFIPVVTSTFLSSNGATAQIKIEVSAGSKTLVNYLADSVSKIASTPATCTTVAGTTTSWVQGTGNYVTTRTLKITICESNCASSAPTVTLAQIQNHLSSLKNTVVVTDITSGSDVCCKVFQVVQNSFPLTDEYCLSPDIATFEDLPSFKDGIWKEATITETYDANIKAGIRISAGYISTTFGDCSYDVNERWDNEPIRMELSLYDEEFNPCKFSELAQARRVVAPKWQKLSAAYVRSEYIKRNQCYFPYEMWSIDPRNREIMDNTALGQIKPNTYFVEYKLQYKKATDTHNFNQKQEHFAPRLFVEEGDLATQVALENALGAITSKFNVNLETVGSNS